MNEQICYLNSQWVSFSDAVLPANDLGLQRGYAIFDFLRVTENVPLYIDDHMDRFFGSATAMRLPVHLNKTALKNVIREMIQKNQLHSSGIRLLLTGGVSPDGYSILSPNLLIIQQTLAPPPETLPVNGYTLYTHEYVREMPQIKTTNYAMAIRLQPWLQEKGGDDIFYHKNGWISECPRSNFFIVTQQDELVTPNENILEGVTRKQILQLAKNHGFAVAERPINLADISEAKEAFISSSTKRILPVKQVDGVHFQPLSPQSLTGRLFSLFLQKEKQAITLV